jgi:chromosome segregation ATPase
MPTKKKTSPPPRKPTRPTRKASASGGSVSALASTQLQQLRKTIVQLKNRLEKEAKANVTAAKIVAEAKKARDVVAAQLKTLRDEGSYLTKELKRALGDAEKREAARRQAVEKIAELRTELSKRTEELKRKSEELAKLTMDSAGRAKDIIAKDIIMSEGTSKLANLSPTVETESVAAETLQLEESPRESSIERELHPERKS